jgi:hypothetical protein
VHRRELLAALATALAGLTGGCLDAFTYTDPTGEPDPDLESDRPAVNETFVAGPMEPYCDREGGDFPPMQERNFPVQSLPADRETATVEAFASSNLPGDTPVSLREDRPELLGWRGRTYDIASRYNSERYFVGWVGPTGGTRAIVVVLHESYTGLRVFETAENC